MKTFTKSTIIISILILSYTCIHAQEKPSQKEHKVKIYLNGIANGFLFEKTLENPNSNLTPYFYSNGADIHIGCLSFAIELRKNSRFSHEFDIMPFSYNNQLLIERINYTEQSEPVYYNGGGNLTDFYSTISYQLTYNSSTENALRPYIGLSPKVFYLYKSLRMFHTNQYPAKMHELGILYSVVPGIAVMLSKNINIDINIPIAFLETKMVSENINFPYSLEGAKTNRTFAHNFFPDKINFRIGVSYRF